MKSIVAMLLAAMLSLSTCLAQSSGHIKESVWLSQSQLAQDMRVAVDNRMMLFQIVGKLNEDGSIVYKGFYKPYPAMLDRFFSYWGMSTEGYKRRKQQMESAGFVEVWHQMFKDLGEQDVHQAVWQKNFSPSKKTLPAEGNSV